MADLNWWLVHGSARTGTGLMQSLIVSCSKKWISDWGLGNMLRLTSDFKYVRFDKARARRDIANNILDNAYPGGGDQLDFSFKQANLAYNEYEETTRMWGMPKRKIFCFRDPSGYMVSAMKKWPDVPMAILQRAYMETLQNYEDIGGDIFEYGPTVTLEDYLTFLKPLNIDGNKFKFTYKGKSDMALTTEEIWEVYENFKRKHYQKFII